MKIREYRALRQEHSRTISCCHHPSPLARSSQGPSEGLSRRLDVTGEASPIRTHFLQVREASKETVTARLPPRNRANGSIIRFCSLMGFLGRTMPRKGHLPVDGAALEKEPQRPRWGHDSHRQASRDSVKSLV